MEVEGGEDRQGHGFYGEEGGKEGWEENEGRRVKGGRGGWGWSLTWKKGVREEGRRGSQREEVEVRGRKGWEDRGRGGRKNGRVVRKKGR